MTAKGLSGPVLAAAQLVHGAVRSGVTGQVVAARGP